MRVWVMFCSSRWAVRGVCVTFLGRHEHGCNWLHARPGHASAPPRARGGPSRDALLKHVTVCVTFSHRVWRCVLLSLPCERMAAPYSLHFIHACAAIRTRSCNSPSVAPVCGRMQPPRPAAFHRVPALSSCRWAFDSTRAGCVHNSGSDGFRRASRERGHVRARSPHAGAQMVTAAEGSGFAQPRLHALQEESTPAVLDRACNRLNNHACCSSARACMHAAAPVGRGRSLIAAGAAQTRPIHVGAQPCCKRHVQQSTGRQQRRRGWAACVRA